MRLQQEMTGGWRLYRPKLSDVPNKDVRREYIVISGSPATRLISVVDSKSSSVHTLSSVRNPLLPLRHILIAFHDGTGEYLFDFAVVICGVRAFQFPITCITPKRLLPVQRSSSFERR